MRELARIVASICQIVSGGVLCFLSSYNAMESLHSTLVSRKFSIDLQAKKVESYVYFIYYGGELAVGQPISISIFTDRLSTNIWVNLNSI